MHRHWKAFGPPVYIAAAMYLGLNKPGPQKAGASTDEEYGDLGDLVSMFGDGGTIG